MRSITIKLNHLPAPELSPNRLRSLHWTKRSELMKVAREEVGWLAKSQWKDEKPMMKARISCEFLIKDRRKRDADNLLAACKPFTDGLIDAGVIFYDDMAHLEYGLIQAVYNSRDETIITVDELLETPPEPTRRLLQPMES